MLWMLRNKGSVIKHVWWQVLMLLLLCAGLVGLTKYGKVEIIPLGGSLTAIIGVVLGLLLGFRTTTASSRYEEGRMLWATMNKTIRNLAINIWGNMTGDEAIDLVEKKSAVNLCLAFAVATKHYLREEYSYQYPDLRDLVRSLHKYSLPSANAPLDSQIQPAAAETNGDVKAPTKLVKSFKLAAYDVPTPTNIPLEIICHLQSFVINHVAKNGTSNASYITTMNAGVNTLIDCLTNFERIVRTPIPMAFSIQLHISIWLSLIALPFQFAVTLGWWSLLIVGLGSFCMLGVLAIGYEIENPFGYDENDLPLDDYCTVLHHELEMLTGAPAVTVSQWMESPLNLPLNFASRCALTATDLAQKSADEVQAILSENARARAIPLGRA